MQVKGKKRSKHNTSIYRGSATRNLFPCPTSTPRVSNSRVSFTSQQAPFTGGENLTRRLCTFTDTKQDVEFFYKGTTTPVSYFTRVQQLPKYFVF